MRGIARSAKKLDIHLGDLVEIGGDPYEVVPGMRGGRTLEPAIGATVDEIDRLYGTSGLIELLVDALRGADPSLSSLPVCDAPPLLVDYSDTISPRTVGARARFREMQDAIDALPDQSDCIQRVVVAPGRYSMGSQTIPSHLAVEGLCENDQPLIAGTFHVGGPLRLNLMGVAVLGDGSEAVVVDDPGAYLALSRVRLANSRGNGLRQRGGTLVASELLVDRTGRNDAARDAGILLEGGCRALLVGVTLAFNRSASLLLTDGATVDLRGDIRCRGNEGAGIVADGPLTRLRARGLLVERTEVRPASRRTGDHVARDELGDHGGLVVRNGAEAQIWCARFEDNQLVAVLAHSGGRIAMQLAQIRRTRQVRDPESRDSRGGMGASAIGGEISLAHFDIAESDLCGVHIAQAGAIDLRHGTVHDNEFGACVQVPGYRLSRLNNETVTFRNNRFGVEPTDFPEPVVAPRLELPQDP